VLACDGAAPSKHLAEQFIERALRAARRTWRLPVHHDIRVDISVPGMTEAGHGKTMLLLQPSGEREQVFEPAAWHHNVFVELRQAGIPQSILEFAAERPNSLAMSGPHRTFNR